MHTNYGKPLFIFYLDQPRWMIASAVYSHCTSALSFIGEENLCIWENETQLQCLLTIQTVISCFINVVLHIRVAEWEMYHWYFWSYYFLFYCGESKYIASFFSSLWVFFLHTGCGTVISCVTPTEQHQWDMAEVNSQVLVRWQLHFWL